MFARILLIAAFAFFVSGCAPAQKEKVVTPKKNPDAVKVQKEKGGGGERGRVDRTGSVGTSPKK